MFGLEKYKPNFYSVNQSIPQQIFWKKNVYFNIHMYKTERKYNFYRHLFTVCI